MVDEFGRNVGDPQYGTEEDTKKKEDKEPLTKGPDWTRHFHPDKWRKQGKKPEPKREDK